MAMSPEEIIEAKSRLYGGLDGVLEPGERIIVIIVGPSQQAIVGTDLRLFVYKSGNKAGARWRRKVTSWAYADVADVALWIGPKSGIITVHPAGPDPRIEAYGASGHGSAQQSPNAISLASSPGTYIQARVEILRTLVAQAHEVQEPAAASPATASPATAAIADQIRALGALRDQGALTEEEFEAKKAQLLEQF
jgi:hypothetical protein